MNYSISAESKSGNDAKLQIKQSVIPFGTTPKTAKELPNPAELLLGAFAACVLKNVERFSGLLNFEYDKASLQLTASRIEKPPHIHHIHYELEIHSSDKQLNMVLLKKNIEKFGTIYNTIKETCKISGNITCCVGTESFN